MALAVEPADEVAGTFLAEVVIEPAGAVERIGAEQRREHRQGTVADRRGDVGEAGAEMGAGDGDEGADGAFARHHHIHPRGDATGGMADEHDR